MYKKLLAVLSLVCLVPLAAHAWSLSTWARNTGGSIAVGDGDPKTSVNGQIFNNYTTSQPITVTVSPNVGYSISRVIYNAVTIDNPEQTAYTVQGPNAQKVQAYFAAQLITLTASAGAGGTVNPTNISGIKFGSALTSAKTFTFTPGGTTVNVVSITGIPAGAAVSSALPAAAGIPVVVTLPVGFVVTSNIALTGAFFAPPTAIAPSSVAVTLGKSVTLDGSSSLGSPDDYFWTQTSGPGYPATMVIADNTPGAQVTFTPPAAGSYTFTLTVTGGSTASTTVTVSPVVVYADIVGTARANCQECHIAANKGIASNVFGKWSSSGHKVKGLICVQCHVGNDSGGHPGYLKKGAVSGTTFNINSPAAGSGNFCVTCHSPTILTDFSASKHSILAGSDSCSFCHVQGVHNPVATCTDCHKVDNTYGLLWPPTGFEFHNSFAAGSANNVCKVCHTTHNPKVLSIKTSCP